MSDETLQKDNWIEELENIINASCTCSDWCLNDRLPVDACCMGSECECKLRKKMSLQNERI